MRARLQSGKHDLKLSNATPVRDETVFSRDIEHPRVNFANLFAIPLKTCFTCAVNRARKLADRILQGP